jgi:FtsP/CotA-like multicopper oxidase with cupredoxin domain
MINNLDPAHSASCADLNSEFCETSVSNLHTHGLHVSSKGLEDGLAAQSDNIFAVVEPGTTEEFAFATPANHMGGTFWYHPHHHHATALQGPFSFRPFLFPHSPFFPFPLLSFILLSTTPFLPSAPS